MKSDISEIKGKAFCKYGEPRYEREHHIFNRGEYAIITGNGGVYCSSLEYFNRLNGDFNKAYLRCKENGYKALPLNYFIIGKTVKILEREYWGSSGTKICLVEVCDWQFIIDMSYLKPIGGLIMNETIIELFPKTAEAVLVDKWFGKEIDKPIFKLLIDGKQKELIAEAKRLEEEELSQN